MVEKTREIEVTNRDRGSVGYTIPDLGNLNRQFESGETKTVTFEELEKLSWIPGGQYILENCLVINDDEAVRQLLHNVEPEYYYSKEDIKKLLTTGSLEELLDCLDFAPDGVKNLVKTVAMELPLNDVNKRQAILDKLGFDITKALELRTIAEGEEEHAETSKRRVAVPSKTTEAAPARRIIKKTE